MIEQISKLIKENQLIVGGLGMVGIGTLIGIFYKIYGYIIRFLTHFCFVTISFESVDHLIFKRVQYWLYEHPYTKRRCRSFNVRFVQKKEERYSDDEEYSNQLFYPGYGRHFIFIGNRPCALYYSKSDSKELAFRETIMIRIFCIFSKSKVRENVINQINSVFDNIQYLNTEIYACTNSYGGWQQLLTKNIKQKPILSRENEYEELLSFISKFYSSEQWYRDRGINYKLGIQFDGIPGSGKTSCILTIAQHFRKHIYMLNLTSTAIDDAKFIELVTSLGKDAILAIEDIDGIYADRDRKDEKSEKEINTVTLSTILNTLDGLLSPEGLVYFITTNHPEKLDKALVRPGRIAYKKHFDNANEYQVRAIFKRFFPDTTEYYINKFAAVGVGKSMACLENHLISNNLDIERAAHIE